MRIKLVFVFDVDPKKFWKFNGGIKLIFSPQNYQISHQAGATIILLSSIFFLIVLMKQHARTDKCRINFNLFRRIFPFK
jgi:hypothetical protein